MTTVILYILILSVCIQNSKSLEYKQNIGQCKLTLAVIICKKIEDASNPTILGDKLDARHEAVVSLESLHNRQIQQTLVLLKSILITERYGLNRDPLWWTQDSNHTSNCINFIVVGRDGQVFQELLNEIERENWDREFTKNLHLSFVKAQYPKGMEWMEHVYRHCATLRLFLPQILPTVTKLIYVDTDIIFIRPPRLLMSSFEYFNENQLAGITPELVIRKDMPDELYNPQAYNTGVMLMHLQRMRQTEWTQKISMVAELILHKAYYGDQDTLIVYFKFYPEELFDIPCHWNFLPKYCNILTECSLETGISAIHGLVGSFFLNMGSPFQTFFAYMQNVALIPSFSIQSFITGLGNALWSRFRNSQKSYAECGRLPEDRHGQIPSFTTQIMKSIEELDYSEMFVSWNRKLSERNLVLRNSTSIFSNNGPMNLSKSSRTIPSSTPGQIVVAVSFIESKSGVQLKLLTALLKSLVMSSLERIQTAKFKYPFKVLIVTKDMSNFERVNSSLHTNWHTDFFSLIQLEPVLASYPKEVDWLAYVFKPGVFFRMVYPQLINYDALLHVDTDFIFNHPIQELWKIFEEFNQHQVLAAAPQISGRGPKDFPPTKFQAGVMLMNLTRMRNVEWTRQMGLIAQILKPDLQSKDILPLQTLLDVYFRHHPDQMKSLKIAWNFLPHYCLTDPKSLVPIYLSKLPSDEIVAKEYLLERIYGFHGVNNSFHRNDTMEPIYRRLFLYVLQFDMSTKLEKDTSQRYRRGILDCFTKSKQPSKCDDLRNFIPTILFHS